MSISKKQSPPPEAPTKISARLTHMKVTVGWTVNMGNYESLRIDIEAEAELGKGDTAKQTHDALVSRLHKCIKDSFNDHVKVFRDCTGDVH